MGFKSLSVTIRPLQQVYSSGQVVQGVVKAVVSSETSCRGITLTMIGKGSVRWTERRNKKTHTYTAKEEYGKKILILWEGRECHNKIHAGNHTFPFTFELPVGMPSSFEHQFGKVYYKVKAMADIPYGIDVTDKAPFTFHNIIDLNRLEEAMYPVTVEHTDNAGLFTDKEASIVMNFDRRGYAPGEEIFISGTVTNNSLKEIKYSEAKIIQKIKFMATHKTREEEKTVQRVYRPSIGARGKDNWSAVPLTVPENSTSSLKYCSIIDISYKLKFVAKFGFCSTVETSTNLIIGSVPIQRRVMPSIPVMTPRAAMIPHHNPSPFITAAMPTAPLLPVEPQNDQPPQYSELSPPTYEESQYLACPLVPHIAGDESDNDEGGFIDSTPKTMESSAYWL